MVQVMSFGGKTKVFVNGYDISGDVQRVEFIHDYRGNSEDYRRGLPLLRVTFIGEVSLETELPHETKPTATPEADG